MELDSVVDELSLSDRATRPIDSVTRRFALGEPSTAATLEVPSLAPTMTVPDTWRRPRPPAPPMQLVGAGLGLYGLRPIPLVGRTAERDLIWEQLQSVVTDQRAAFVLIRGAAGRGKSRLARWISERANECGVGSVWRALHGPVAGPIDGLGPMLVRKLSCVSMTRPEAKQRLDGLLAADGIGPGFERDALLELLVPGGEADEPVRFTNPVERYVIIRRALERDAQRGPVILYLDDVQWGLDSLAFAHHLLRWQKGSPSPILILATARAEALIEGSLEDLQLREILRRDRTTVLELGPLGQEAHYELVGGLLGLSGDLASDVRRRTDGNPLFATQLVGDWVRRGVLVPGPRGFVLKPGERAEIPDDIHEVWVRRLAPILGIPDVGDDRGWAAVEIAAALGQNVDRREWTIACADACAVIPNDLVDRLANHGLVLAESGGFEWIHGMLRESVERRSRERGTWPRWNRACAAMIRTCEATAGTKVAPERLGLHLLAAGDGEAALEPLLRGAQRLRHLAEMSTGLRLLDLRAEAMEQLDLPPSDERWGEGWNIRSVLHNALGRMDEARRWGERSVRSGRRFGWGEALAGGLQCAAWGPFWAGDLPTARRMLEEAVAWYERHDNPVAEAGASLSLAYVAMFERKMDEARARSRRAEELHRTTDNKVGAVEAYRLRSTIERMAGNYQEAMRVSREVIARMGQLGNEIGTAEAHNELAETARYIEDWPLAETHYRAALSVYVARGSLIADIMRTNLSLLMLAQGRLVEAESILDQLPARIAVEDSWLVACVVGLARMAVAAGKADWEAWDREAAVVQEVAASGNSHDRDTAWTAEIAAGIADEMGAHMRAEEARVLARKFHVPDPS
jgi:tetratricopeptide (TPR) repeat protein